MTLSLFVAQACSQVSLPAQANLHRKLGMNRAGISPHHPPSGVYEVTVVCGSAPSSKQEVDDQWKRTFPFVSCTAVLLLLRSGCACGSCSV